MEEKSFMDMTTGMFANQKKPAINKAKSDKDNKYSIMNLKALETAVMNLSHSGLKLWLYLNKNQNGFKLVLHFQATVPFGITSKSMYDRAVQELEKKGYLVKRENPESDGTNYDFYELVEKNDEIIVEVHKD